MKTTLNLLIAATCAQLISSCLEEIFGKPVVDETRGTNCYDFQLLWDEKNRGK